MTDSAHRWGTVTGFAALLLATSVARAAPGDMDDDGIGDDIDVCITVADPGQQDSNNDGFGDACADPTAVIADDVVFLGSWIGARGELASGVTVGAGSIIGRGARIGTDSTVGSDAFIGPRVITGAGVQVADGVSVGFSSQLGDDVRLEADGVLGARVELATDVSVGANSLVGRATTIDANTAVGSDSVVSSSVRVGSGVQIGSRVRIRRGATVDDFARVADDVRIGRDAVVGPDATVAANAVIRGEAELYEDLSAGEYMVRREVRGTPRKRLVLQDGARSWSDGSYAPSCLAYLQANDPSEVYAGDIGDGVYRLATTGAPFDATCNMSGGGWTLAMRVADSGNTFTFLSTHWTNATTLNASSLDPLTDLDAKFPAFNQVVGTEIRGCLRNLSTGAYGCKSYPLPNARTLLDLFSNTPVGSRENNRGYYFSETRSQRLEWQTMWGRPPGESSTSNNYVDTAINMDDDLSNYRARVRFGLGLNNEGNISTLNDTIGFGASAYFNTSAGGLAESPWRVSAGAAIGPSLIRTRGQIWVR